MSKKNDLQLSELTARDIFAMAALIGLLAKEGSTDYLMGTDATEAFSQTDAKRAYIYADSMLFARKV